MIRMLERSQSNVNSLFKQKPKLLRNRITKEDILIAMKNTLLMVCFSILLGCGYSMDSHHPALVLETLYQRHEQWQGTPYQLGGRSQQGIDCSGFVALTFNQEFGIQLPRTTAAQAQLPGSVKKAELQTGDLVFFKIPQQKKYYHVGIYLEDHQFLHASTSQGVTVSDLHDDYWRTHFWQAVRVLGQD